MPRKPHTAEQALACLRSRARTANREGMARFGIAIEAALGVSMPDIRACAAAISHDHDLAGQLWQSGLHEARILASLVDKPQWVTPEQMDRWTAGFNSWDLCDQVCGNLWDRTIHAPAKIRQWAEEEATFTRRAAFATIAWRAVHAKKIPDGEFIEWLELVRAGSKDPRNFVKKAVNWALRQIGKRSPGLHAPALALARELAASQNRTAAWIGKDAVRELDNPKIRLKLGLPSEN